MGNQITAKAPAQILSVDSYFTELTEYTKTASGSLGSTRFMKVASATHVDGTEVVVKVFAKHESLQLDSYRKKLEDIRRKLHGVANALPFQHFWDTDKAAYLVRQHIHYSLYDRISTRPFLSAMEKRWIVFQLLKVLEECEARKICHGDIKTENVLLTGWCWVMLGDFASFKPTLLPDDNPADFSFYFDTSRRRTCYLAPERLCPPEFFQETPMISSSQRSRVLVHPMDIFSLGCVIAELFLDGRPLFTLSQLLEYCNGDREGFEITLKKINDKLIRRMVRHMTQLDPRERLSAKQYLLLYKDNIFPEYFYFFLHDYFKTFSTTSQLTPDQTIQKLYEDIDAILANVILNNQRQDRESGYGDALVIVLSAITSSIRVAQFVATKLQALQMVKRIALHLTDECILDRVVPYLILFVRDKWSSVRAEAIRTLTCCLSLVQHLQSSDFNLFMEYILPALGYIPSDSDVIVRLAFAECVAELAQTAQRFLELAQLDASQEDDSVVLQYQVQGSYDSELLQLQDSFQGKIVHLLSDTESSVKKAFLKHSAGKLSVFFGPQRAKEVILSHMITFLNDKSDWELHRAFFECIVGVATLLRHHSLAILEPLLQQGLSDAEEVVVCQTVEAMTILCSEKLFDRLTLFSYVSSLAPFLVYPNIWIRYGVVGFLMASYQQLDQVDCQCFLLPRVIPYLKYPVIQLQDVAILLSAIKEPIPRKVLDYLLKQQNIYDIFQSLLERANVRRSAFMDDEGPTIVPGHLLHTFKKLQSLGLNEEHENSLLALKDHILKQHASRQQTSEVESHYNTTRGVINIKSLPGAITPRSVDLIYKPHIPPSSTASGNKKKSGSKANTTTDKVPLNEDWDRIFGESPPSSKVAIPKDSVSSSPATTSATSKPKKIAGGSPSFRRRMEVYSDSAILSKSSPDHASFKDQQLGSREVGLPPLQHPGERGAEMQLRPPLEGRKTMGSAEALGVRSGTVAENYSSHMEADRSQSSENLMSPDQEGVVRRLPGGHGQVGGATARHKRSRSEGALARLSLRSTSSWRPDDASDVSQAPSSPGFVENSMVKVEYASCRENLRELLEYKQSQYEEDMRYMDMDLTKNAAFQTSPGWTPKGQLVAHIHEHRDAVNRLRMLPESTMFASFSDDGTTKLWDVSRLEGRTVVNKPRMSYGQQGGKIKTGVFCQKNKSIAAASTNGSLQIFNIEIKKMAGANKRQLMLDMTIDTSTNGSFVDMATFNAGGQEVICYATSMGQLHGLDLRSGKYAWELTNNAKYGLVLSMAVDPFENWVALGTSLGYHVVWDMRFQLPIRHWQHTGHGGRSAIHHVYRLSAHPTQPSSLISAVSYNNEVSVWDMETVSRRQMLWASPATPFSPITNNARQQETVRAMSTCVIDNCPVVLTGGTDRSLRLWNLVDPSQCCCVVRPRLHSKKLTVDYQSKIIEGVDVFTEMKSAMTGGSSGGAASSASFVHSVASSGGEAGSSGESAHSSLHVDFITDLSMVAYKQYQFIVSASHDGVIKYWK